MTAAGIVRWSSPPSFRWRGYPFGLEWLALEETSRQRLQSFLQRSGKTVPGASFLQRRPLGWKIVLLSFLVIGFLWAGFVGFWFLALFQENRQLHETVQQREQLVTELTQREQGLRQALTAATTQVSTALEEVVRLGQHAQRLEGNMQQLTLDVQRAQESFAGARAEREALMQRILDLEQERLQLAERLSSIPALQHAIQEAIAARKEARRAVRRLRLQARREAAHQQAQAGNHGYLIRNGRATVAGSTVWIRVYDPESLSPESINSSRHPVTGSVDAP